VRLFFTYIAVSVAVLTPKQVVICSVLTYASTKIWRTIQQTWGTRKTNKKSIAYDNLDSSISSYTEFIFAKFFSAYYFCSPRVIFLAHYIYGCSFSSHGEWKFLLLWKYFLVVEKNLYWVFCTAMLRTHVLVCLFEWHLFFLVISIFPLLIFGRVRNSLIN